MNSTLQVCILVDIVQVNVLILRAVLAQHVNMQLNVKDFCYLFKVFILCAVHEQCSTSHEVYAIWTVER